LRTKSFKNRVLLAGQISGPFGETALDTFVYVPAIRAAEKPCEFSLGDLSAKFRDGRFDVPTRAIFPVGADTETLLTIPFRWLVSCRGEHQRCWSSSLVLDGIRIDCIDFEERVKDRRGFIGSGWHRHFWDDEERGCELTKECLGGFGNFGSRLDFVRDASQLLGIELRKDGGQGYGETGMLFS
jgi:hypothetical protein